MGEGMGFTAAQAVEAGARYSQLSASVAKGRCERPWRGIYVTCGATWKERLAAAGMAADGVISHRAAARLHGLWGLEDSSDYDLTIPPDRRFSRRGLVVHQSPLDEQDLSTVDGISGVTTLARTVIDLAAVLYGDAYAIAFESAWCLDPNLLDAIERRLEQIGSVGRHGMKRLRALIADARRRERPLESPLEVRFWRRLRRWRVPLPTTGVEVDDGAPTRYRLDFCYPEQKLAIETDGFTWHGSRDRWAADCRKQTRAAAAGYRLMRITPEDLDDQADAALFTRFIAALGVTALRPTLRWGAQLRWPGPSRPAAPPMPR